MVFRPFAFSLETLFRNKGKHLRKCSYKKEVFFNVEEQHTKNTTSIIMS